MLLHNKQSYVTIELSQYNIKTTMTSPEIKSTHSHDTEPSSEAERTAFVKHQANLVRVLASLEERLEEVKIEQ